MMPGVAAGVAALLAAAAPAAAFLPAVAPGALAPRQALLTAVTPVTAVTGRLGSQRHGLRSCTAQMSTTAVWPFPHWLHPGHTCALPPDKIVED